MITDRGKTPFCCLVGENSLCRGMEQSVARYAHNVEVGGFESPSHNNFIAEVLPKTINIMIEAKTIEEQIAAAILEKDVAELIINGKVYRVAPPTIATLILVSEIISRLPVVEKVANEKIVASALHHAKDFRALGDIAAVLILGAKDCDKKNGFIWRVLHPFKRNESKRAILADTILNNVRPTVLFNVIVQRFQDMEISSFFGITISLSEANILKPTKEMDEEKP